MPSSLPTMAQRLTIEVIGTALLCYTVAVTIGNGEEQAALAIGSTLMCAIYGEAALHAYTHPARTL